MFDANLLRAAGIDHQVERMFAYSDSPLKNTHQDGEIIAICDRDESVYLWRPDELRYRMATERRA